MYTTNHHRLFFILIVTIGQCSCNKFLETKPDQKLAIVTKLEDVQALLDDYNTINAVYPTILELSSDDYYTSAENIDLTANKNNESDIYLWRKNEIFSSAWQQCYRVINQTNIALDGLINIENSSANLNKLNSIRGNAHFLRGYNFFLICQLYGNPFNQASAATDLGIPLRLKPDVLTEKTVRSSVQESFIQVLSDLKIAAALLPEKQLVKSRANKSAALGAISRVYLSMQQYDSAAKYSNMSLMINDSLLNFNELPENSSSPIQMFNKEVSFHAISSYASLLQPSAYFVDTVLIDLYSEFDLRKSRYFRKTGDRTYVLKGMYGGNTSGFNCVFGGIANDELFLIRAEAFARVGNLEQSLTDLNKLLETRYETGKYTPYFTNDAEELLDKILIERRKELIFRGIRWMDLRRLKFDADRVVVPKRKINDQVFELLPSNPRYTLAIPAQVINLSGIPQNP